MAAYSGDWCQVQPHGPGFDDTTHGWQDPGETAWRFAGNLIFNFIVESFYEFTFVVGENRAANGFGYGGILAESVNAFYTTPCRSPHDTRGRMPTRTPPHTNTITHHHTPSHTIPHHPTPSHTITHHHHHYHHHHHHHHHYHYHYSAITTTITSFSEALIFRAGSFSAAKA